MAGSSDPPREARELLRSLFEATARQTGDDFFRALALHLAELLDVRHAFVSELLPERKQARALAYWADGRFLRPFVYDLADTPCETVLSGEILHIPDDLLAVYPKDEILGKLAFCSYLGIPLVSHEGQVLGHVAATDDKPMVEMSRHDYSTFKVFASRATAELERRRADAALASVQSKLIQAEKLAALGQVTAGVTHEINTPIGVIQGNTDLSQRVLGKLRGAIDDVAWNAEAEKYLSALRDAAEANATASGRLAEILARLQKFVRVDAAEMETIDIHQSIESTLALVGAQWPDGVVIVKDFGEVPPIDCRPAELNQVFMTLLQNAKNAVDDKGTITIKTWSDEQSAYASIADDGCGIPADRLDKLFDIGFSAKGARMGMRVGLFSAYHVIKSHDGGISVQSSAGGGTRFTITLPRGGSRAG